MSKNLSFFLLSVPAVLAVVLLSLTGAAQAGFEWRGATSAPAAAAPVAEDLPAPVIMWEGTASEMPPALMPAEKVESVMTMPVAPAPAMSATPVFSQPASANEDAVAGFGSDMPLAIALQQVVPPGHQFSFASGVDPGGRVSWQGGKPWREVLAEMLSAKELGYKIQNNVVVIAPAAMMPATPVAQQETVVWNAHDVSGVQPVTPAAPAADETAPVDIRRQKPSALLGKIKRMTRSSAKEAQPVENVENIAVPRAVNEPASGQGLPPISGQGLPPISGQGLPPMPADHTPLDKALMEHAMPVPVTKAPVDSGSAFTPLAVTPGLMKQDTVSSAPPMLSAPTWHGATGQTLRDVLKNWSDVAGVELYWSIDYDYRLEEDFAHNGTYDEAVGGILDKFASARPQPYGQLHQNGDSPRVLVVKSYDLIP